MRESDPTCPFCAAPWTPAMIELFDSCTIPGGCACCVDGPGTHVLAWPIAPEPMPPSADIVCEACSKTIYAAFKG